jgi:hypothetical protein
MGDFNLRKHSSCGTTQRIIAGSTRGVTRFFFFDFFLLLRSSQAAEHFQAALLSIYIYIYKISGSAASGPGAPPTASSTACGCLACGSLRFCGAYLAALAALRSDLLVAWKPVCVCMLTHVHMYVRMYVRACVCNIYSMHHIYHTYYVDIM